MNEHMNVLPYPPVPEFGWYDDDANAADDVVDSEDIPVQASPNDAATDSAQLEGTHTDDKGAGSSSPASAAPLNIADREDDVEDWDGTVLAAAFIKQNPTTVFRLYNDDTGQEVLIDRGTLLGRKPSGTVPEGVQSVRLEDPTRTVSRNHAAISFDTDGVLWIEDYGSLNGTYMIKDGVETEVAHGTPMKIEPPITLRLGDQFFTLEEHEELLGRRKRSR